jgi:hypothetical protein
VRILRFFGIIDKLESNQAKLDKVLANQDKILAKK